MKSLSNVVGLFLTFMIATAATAYAQALTTFRIANGTSGENPAALWVGVEQGFYRRHGLDLEVIYMRTGPLAVSALASGDVQTVLTSSNAVLNIAAGGLDVAVLGTLVNRPDGDFMARPEIKRPEDVNSKIIAIQSIGGGGWANNMLAMDYLSLDVDRDKISFIVLGDQPSRIQALETNRAQASWMGATFSAPLKKKRLHRPTRSRALANPVCRDVTGQEAQRCPARAKNLRCAAQRHHRCDPLLSEARKQTQRHADHRQAACGSPAWKMPRSAIKRC